MKIGAFLASLFLVTAMMLHAAAPVALAGNGGGRVYDPKKLRPKAEKASRGRILKDPRQMGPEPRQPTPYRAEIPNPEPQRRGGSGYSRRGNYFYEDTKPIRTYSSKRGQVERVTIPHPNPRNH